MERHGEHQDQVEWMMYSEFVFLDFIGLINKLFANDCKTWNDGKSVRESLQIKCEENTVMVNVDYYEEIQLKTAKSLAVFQVRNVCHI